MNKYLGLFLIIFVVLCGCQVVSFKNPIGKTFVPEDKTNYEGIWQSQENEIIYMKFLKDSKTLRTTSIKWDKERDDYSLESNNLLLSEIGNNKYLNVEIPGLKGFFIYEYNLNGNNLVLWTLDLENSVFKKAIEEKTLLGTVTKSKIGKTEVDNIYIESSPEDIESFIKNNNNLFSYKESFILRKIADLK